MTLIATDSNRISNVVKHEYEPCVGFCREVVTVNESAQKTYKLGTVLAKVLAGGAATATAGGSNTGNGTMGTVTVGATAQVGTYTLKIFKAAANAGDFTVTDPQGEVVGIGTVAVAFSNGGLSFTLADGSNDFAVGDTFTIAVTGTEKYRIVLATDLDGRNISASVVIGDNLNVGVADYTVAATTDTKVIVLARGPAIVADAALSYDASINTDAEKAALYAQLKNVGIIVETQK